MKFDVTTLLKWLASLLSGGALVFFEYLRARAAEGGLDGTDAFVAFILTTLVVKGATWVVAKFGPKKPPVVVAGSEVPGDPAQASFKQRGSGYRE